MTAFARQEHQATWGQLYWEIRSVNHRYLEIALRLPEDLRSLEPHIRESIQKHVKRGKIDCALYLKPNKLENFQLNVNFFFCTEKKITALPSLKGTQKLNILWR